MLLLDLDVGMQQVGKLGRIICCALCKDTMLVLTSSSFEHSVALCGTKVFCLQHVNDCAHLSAAAAAAVFLT